MSSAANTSRRPCPAAGTRTAGRRGGTHPHGADRNRQSRRYPCPLPRRTVAARLHRRHRRRSTALRAAPTRPPAAQPEPSRHNFSDLEKRFGTQWVVWVGGVALALGGIFLVRYSIEQGLFGPGLRIIRGAVLALVLVGLGELARRKENHRPASTQMPRAHIPSILTAAGTTVAYADVWAAYALYEFLSPAHGLRAARLVALATLAAALMHGPALGGLGLVGAYVTPLLVSHRAAELLGALRLSRGRDRRRLCARALPDVALARDHRGRVLDALDVCRHRRSASADRCRRMPSTSLVGFALAAAFIVAGLALRPARRARQGRGRCRSGVLAGYLFGAFVLVDADAPHANTGAVDAVRARRRRRGDRLAQRSRDRWRCRSRRRSRSLVIVHWAVNFSFEHAVRCRPARSPARRRSGRSPAAASI